jgi:hypothetical protein
MFAVSGWILWPSLLAFKCVLTSLALSSYHFIRRSRITHEVETASTNNAKISLSYLNSIFAFITLYIARYRPVWIFQQVARVYLHPIFPHREFTVAILFTSLCFLFSLYREHKAKVLISKASLSTRTFNFLYLFVREFHSLLLFCGRINTLIRVCLAELYFSR